MSEHPRKTALRVANIPELEFESANESDNAPTVWARLDFTWEYAEGRPGGGRKSARRA